MGRAKKPQKAGIVLMGGENGSVHAAVVEPTKEPQRLREGTLIGKIDPEYADRTARLINMNREPEELLFKAMGFELVTSALNGGRLDEAELLRVREDSRKKTVHQCFGCCRSGDRGSGTEDAVQICRICYDEQPQLWYDCACMTILLQLSRQLGDGTRLSGDRDAAGTGGDDAAGDSGGGGDG